MASLALTLRRPHLLFRKQSSKVSGLPEKNKTAAETKSRQLCNFEELPKWCQDNPYIRTGYRPISNSYHRCIHSLGYWHNESMNIYTHLVPAIFLALALPTLQIQISNSFAHAPWMDRFMLTLTPMAAIATMSLSSTYHTLMNHSALVSASCLLMDFTGILFLILASFISGIFVGFYDSHTHQYLYWGMILVLISISCLLVMHPRLEGPLYRRHRTTAFVCTALSGFAPVVHACVLHGFSEAFWQRGVMWWLAEGFWYGLGTFFFSTRIPEKLTRKCDIFGSSHQIFHVCVVLGASAHCWGVFDTWRKAI